MDEKQTPKNKLMLMIQACEEKKAEDIVALDLTEFEGSICDVFLICEGKSERQVQAIWENVHQHLKKHGFQSHHIEGTSLNHWVLMDFGDIVIHVFLDKIRQFYRLEDLWRTAVKMSPKL